MKRILSLSLAFAIFLIPSIRSSAAPSADSVERYLVVGFDEAAQNTDVIAVISYQASKNRLTVLQIPRDTYFCFGGVQNKLNQLYPHVLAGRETKEAREEAMRALSDAVSSFLGLSIDRYVGVSLDDFSTVIDRIGGVSMTLPSEITYFDEESGRKITLPQGPRLLSGKESVAFVRYRVGYANGDLGRIDAQKAFISALLSKFGSGLSLRAICSVFSELRGSTVTDLPLSLALRCGYRFVSDYKRTDIFYLTLPGEPCMFRGISYYVANRASSEGAISKWLCFSESPARFDPLGKLTDPRAAEILEIYQRDSVPYHVYTDAELRLSSSS